MQHSFIHFLWAKEVSINVIQSEMQPVYGDKCFIRSAINVWCKKFASGHENVVDEKEPGCRVSTTSATIAAVDFLMLSFGLTTG